MADIASQLETLQAERARLAAQLEGLEAWRLLHSMSASDAVARSGSGLLTARQEIESRLSDNAVYQAWRKLGEVIALIETETRTEQERNRPRLPREHRELLAIKGLDEPTAVLLVGAGVTSLKQIADWTAADVKALKKSLKLGRRISQEGWIEQAALLTRQQPAPPPSSEGAEASWETAAEVTEVRQSRPNSLTARLFARTPLPGHPRSLRAAIEAAEQADQEASPSLLRRQAGDTGTRPAPAPAASRRLAPEPAQPAEPSLPAPTPSAAESSGPHLAPIQPQASEPAPLLASLPPLLEEEAEVVIIARPKPADQRSAEPLETNDGPLFEYDLEQQGGEGYDPRSVAALRGVIEETTVEIVKKRR